jgi:hypothetical protein
MTSRRSIFKRLLGALVGGSVVEAKPVCRLRYTEGEWVRYYTFPATNLQRWKPYIIDSTDHDWPSILKGIEFKPDKGARP